MRIAFLHTGFWNAARRWREPGLLDDLAHFPTTHQSEVQGILICHWLREMGHEVTFLSEAPLPAGPQSNHFDVVPIAGVDPSRFDALFLFALHAARVVARTDLLSLPWRHCVLWMDALRFDDVMGEAAACEIDAVAWATPEIILTEQIRFPGARQAVCEHATVFPRRPEMGSTQLRGIYAGRLPQEYLDQVRCAAKVAPITAHALWVQVGSEQVRLRPGQYGEDDLRRARTGLPLALDLQPGVNMIANATEVSTAAFGLCPAALAPPHRQVASASKFYDYAALGLPSVMADNVPEAQHVREHPFLGELYDQTVASLHAAINKVLAEANIWPSRFAARRRAVQDWAFGCATYRHRAEVIHRLL